MAFERDQRLSFLQFPEFGGKVPLSVCCGTIPGFFAFMNLDSADEYEWTVASKATSAAVRQIEATSESKSNKHE